MVELTSDVITVGSVADVGVENVLKCFSTLANKSTGASHPLDQKCWFEFLTLAHHAHNKLDIDLVISTLKELVWRTCNRIRVATESANNPQQRNNDMFAEILAGISIVQRPERYVELNKAKKQMQQREQKLELLQQYNNKTDVEKILAKYPQATAFLPMKASAVDMTVLIDQKANVVKIVDLRPWH